MLPERRPKGQPNRRRKGRGRGFLDSPLLGGAVLLRHPDQMGGLSPSRICNQPSYSSCFEIVSIWACPGARPPSLQESSRWPLCVCPLPFWAWASSWGWQLAQAEARAALSQASCASVGSEYSRDRLACEAERLRRVRRHSGSELQEAIRSPCVTVTLRKASSRGAPARLCPPTCVCLRPAIPLC